MDVAVQVPAYREGEQFSEVLEAILEQDDAGHDVTVEAWVTLSPPGLRGECTTWQDAVDVDGVQPFEAAPGKLSARNQAHDRAAHTLGADAIVSWDADAMPMHDRVLASLLEPLEPGEVVVANSNPLAAPFERNLLAGIVDFAGALEDALRPHVHGQLHAMTAKAWRDHLGPFDSTHIDQTNVSQVRALEEFRFRTYAEQVGEVVDVEDAVISNDTRRHRCRIQTSAGLGEGRSEFCKSREGEVTFQPRGLRAAASDRQEFYNTQHWAGVPDHMKYRHARDRRDGAGCGCGGR